MRFSIKSIVNMLFVVKNTIKRGLGDLLCPYSCILCGERGGYLCLCCKKYWMSELSKERKRVKSKVLKENSGFSGVWVGGFRKGVLERMIKDYKYGRKRGLGVDLVDIWEGLEFGEEWVVVPLPTIKKHIRERGFDHSLRLAKELVGRKGWRMDRLLVRDKNTVQVGVDEEMRLKQAKEAYKIRGKIDPKGRYLLLDDVMTTGASMRAARDLLRKEGVKKIGLIVLAVGKD